MTLVRRPWTTILQTHLPSFMKAFLLPSCIFFSAVNSIAEWWWTMKWFGCGCKLGYHRFETILGPIIADHTWLLKSIWRHQKWKLSFRATPARLGMIYELRIFIWQSVWIGLSKSPFMIASKPFRSLGRHWRGWFLSFQTLRLVPKYTRVRYTDVGSLSMEYGTSIHVQVITTIIISSRIWLYPQVTK